MGSLPCLKWCMAGAVGGLLGGPINLAVGPMGAGVGNWAILGVSLGLFQWLALRGLPQRRHGVHPGQHLGVDDVQPGRLARRRRFNSPGGERHPLGSSVPVDEKRIEFVLSRGLRLETFLGFLG
ncbi:MAG: hypothetical protein ACLFV5_10215 [Anaerolineales bacterium]